MARSECAYRILVASAGDASSLGAIRIASALARKENATVHALTVATLLSHSAPSPLQAAPPILTEEENQRVALETMRRQLATVPGTENWELHAATGRPPERIVAAAERWPASLLIIGLGKHGTMGRLFGSDAAVKIAQLSKVPVLAVPPDGVDLPACAAAAIDFTESSIAAAGLAARLLGPSGILTLVHASLLVEQDHEAGTLPDVYTTGATEKLETIRARLHDETKHRIHALVVHSDIVDGLLSFVEREQCDLLALGAHDRGFLDRILLGSVRTRVLRNAHCQVLVVPHASSDVTESPSSKAP